MPNRLKVWHHQYISGADVWMSGTQWQHSSQSIQSAVTAILHSLFISLFLVTGRFSPILVHCQFSLPPTLLCLSTTGLSTEILAILSDTTGS